MYLAACSVLFLYVLTNILPYGSIVINRTEDTMQRIRTTAAAVEQMAAVNHVTPDRRTFVVSVVLGGVRFWGMA
jgi:hypothetical protein